MLGISLTTAVILLGALGLALYLRQRLRRGDVYLGYRAAAGYYERVYPLAASGLHFENVSFASADGFRIKGWYVPAGSDAAVVFCGDRGMNRGHRFLTDQADYFHRRGFGVLLFDYRGFGRGDGDTAGKPHITRACDDAQAAVAYARRRTEIAPAKVGVLGFGFGALAGLAAGREAAAVAVVGDWRLPKAKPKTAAGRLAAKLTPAALAGTAADPALSISRLVGIPVLAITPGPGGGGDFVAARLRDHAGPHWHWRPVAVDWARGAAALPYLGSEYFEQLSSFFGKYLRGARRPEARLSFRVGGYDGEFYVIKLTAEVMGATGREEPFEVVFDTQAGTLIRRVWLESGRHELVLPLEYPPYEARALPRFDVVRAGPSWRENLRRAVEVTEEFYVDRLAATAAQYRWTAAQAAVYKARAHYVIAWYYAASGVLEPARDHLAAAFAGDARYHEWAAREAVFREAGLAPK